MSSPSTYLNPALGRQSGCVSPTLVSDFLRCVPRPRPGGPAAYGRQLIAVQMRGETIEEPPQRVEAYIEP